MLSSCLFMGDSFSGFPLLTRGMDTSCSVWYLFTGMVSPLVRRSYEETAAIWFFLVTWMPARVKKLALSFEGSPLMALSSRV